MSDVSGMNLREPEQMAWDNYQSGGSKYVRPPAAATVDAAGNATPIVYYGQAPSNFNYKDFLGVTNESEGPGYRSFLIDPIKIVKSGPGADGYELRFTRVSTKKFVSRKTGEPTDASSVGNYLRACGVLAKPQKNAEYEAAVKSTAGKVFPITIDWFAKSKDTGEVIRGYNAFPDDPDRPGQRMAILKQGELYHVLDEKGQRTGQTQPVQSEVLFANAQVRYFRDQRK